jgi:hypothetical protein
MLLYLLGLAVWIYNRATVPYDPFREWVEIDAMCKNSGTVNQYLRVTASELLAMSLRTELTTNRYLLSVLQTLVSYERRDFVVPVYGDELAAMWGKDLPLAVLKHCVMFAATIVAVILITRAILG